MTPLIYFGAFGLWSLLCVYYGARIQHAKQSLAAPPPPVPSFESLAGEFRQATGRDPDIPTNEEDETPEDERWRA